MTDQLAVNLDKVDSKMGELLTYLPPSLHPPFMLTTHPTSAFESHPQMQPPSPNPSLFFLFDFIRNTHRTLKNIDFQKFASGDPSARQEAQEVMGRNQFANSIVGDRSGRLAMLTGGDPSNPVDFGDEIRAKAGELVAV